MEQLIMVLLMLVVSSANVWLGHRCMTYNERIGNVRFYDLFWWVTALGILAVIVIVITTGVVVSRLTVAL